jgi:hypothetical protein
VIGCHTKLSDLEARNRSSAALLLSMRVCGKDRGTQLEGSAISDMQQKCSGWISCFGGQLVREYIGTEDFAFVYFGVGCI